MIANFHASNFEDLEFDSVTVAPYMGKDSILPYLEFKNKWTILLSLTSNSGAEDFQYLNIEGSNNKLFQQVIKNSLSWSSHKNMMYVVGANRIEDLIKIRKFEILIVDDNSKDGTRQLLKKMLLLFKNLKYISKKTKPKDLSKS